MPIDVSIYDRLIRPLPDPLEQQQRMQQIQSGQQEQQIRAIALQQIQEQRAAQQRASQAFAQMPRNPDGTIDTAKFAQMLGQSQLAPEHITSVINTLDSYNKVLSEQAQRKYDGAATIANDFIKNHPDNLDADAVHTYFAMTKALGYTDPGDEDRAAQMLTLPGVTPKQIFETARSRGSQFKPKYEKVGAGETLVDLANQQAVYTAPPKASDVALEAQRKAETEKIQAETAGTLPMTPYQQAEAAARQKQLQISAGQLSVAQQREKREGAQAAQQNLSSVAIDPSSREYRIAQDIANGTLTMNDFQRMYGRAVSNSAMKAAIYDTARQLNPAFNPAQFELGFRMAGNPQIRQRIVAISSLDPVIDRAEQLASQVGNTDVPALNKLLQGAKFQIGNRTVTNFRQLQTLLGDEVGNALGVGTGSDLKTRLGLDLVNPNLGPGQFKDTMEQLRNVLDARKRALLGTMGPYGGGVEAPQATPAAAPGGARLRVQAPDGRTGTLPAGSPLPAGWKVLGPVQ